MRGTIIAWTDSTFNVAWGCVKVSPGCDACYADTLSSKYGHNVWGKDAPRRTFDEEHWSKPLQWDAKAAREGKRHRVFCSSMCDVFEAHDVIDRERERLWSLIRQTPCLDWQLLTKRAGRIAGNLPADWGEGYPNVWLGVSIENNDYVWRADALRKVPATVRFVSYEPALGALDKLDLAGIDWLIFGGESGKGYRPMDVQWARDVRRRCAESGTAFFFKQSAAIRTEMGTMLDGETVREFPTPRLPVEGECRLRWEGSKQEQQSLLLVN